MNLVTTTKVAQASLPQTYEAARSALAQCQAIDECKDWADKAAALASYAKQADDLELEKMAIRIRARAMRRAGELAKQMMQPPHRPSDKHHGGVILKSKAELQDVSGFSRRQMDTALAVANVPQPVFDAQVDAVNPATVTELARQGAQKRDTAPDPETWLKGRDPATFNKVLHMIGEIEDYSRSAASWDLDALLPNLTDNDRERLRRFVAAIDSIHDKIITRI